MIWNLVVKISKPKGNIGKLFPPLLSSDAKIEIARVTASLIWSRVGLDETAVRLLLNRSSPYEFGFVGVARQHLLAMVFQTVASVISSTSAIRIALSIRRHPGIRLFRFVGLIRYSQIPFDSMISWPDSGSSAGILFKGLGLFLVATRSAKLISITSNWLQSPVIWAAIFTFLPKSEDGDE